MNEDQVERWIQNLIAEDKLHKFYDSTSWRRLRKEVLEESKNECQVCKKNKIYTRANHVHHIQFVRKHPRFALSKVYKFQGKEYTNLIAVCKNCHETVCHPERLRINAQKPLTEERW